MKEWSCHDPKMAAYCNEVRKLEDKFDGLELNHVARHFNEAADELAKAASGRMPVPDGVFVSDQLKPSIRYPEPAGPGEVGNAPPVPDPSTSPKGINAALPDSALEADPSDPVVMEITADSAAGADPLIDWRTPYLDYLVRDTLPADRTEARRIARRAKSFTIIDQELYKKSHTWILQHCIPIEQGKPLIQYIHAGACGHHAAPRTLVGNAFRQGFYWPTAVADATQVVCTCEGCQFFARQTHLPAQALQTIPITWPFAVWGLDLFTGKRFLQFCDDHHIRVDWAAVAHPRTNGQVERANGMILQGLKPRIFDRLKKFGGRWVAELPAVFWILRTTPSRNKSKNLQVLKVKVHHHHRELQQQHNQKGEVYSSNSRVIGRERANPCSEEMQTSSFELGNVDLDLDMLLPSSPAASDDDDDDSTSFNLSD
nr:uncharacterized protein LOC117849110 [Setaria viridis]